VVVNDLDAATDGTGASAGPAERTVKEIEDLGGTAVADLSTVATVEGGQAIVDTALEAFGRVDIVISNAGILRDKAFHNLTPELLDPVLDVHLKGAFHVLRPAWVKLREAGSWSPPPTPASWATSARPTTARPRWGWSAWPGCSPRRAPAGDHLELGLPGQAAGGPGRHRPTATDGRRAVAGRGPGHRGTGQPGPVRPVWWLPPGPAARGHPGRPGHPQGQGDRLPDLRRPAANHRGGRVAPS